MCLGELLSVRTLYHACFKEPAILDISAFGGSYNFSSLLEFSSSPSDGVAQHFPYFKYIFALEDSILEVSMIFKLLYN